MHKITMKRILYILCFAMFCLIEQRIKTASSQSGWIEAFRELTGVVMSILVLSHYPLSSFRKYWKPCAIWSALSIPAGLLFVLNGEPLFYFWRGRIVIFLAVFLMGITLIRIVGSIMEAKKIPVFVNKPPFVLWLVMMGLMCAFRQDIYWPKTYLLMFICFYLVDYSKEERQDLFHGMLEGILLAFFLMQGWCFLFRPYDQVRYLGIFSNCNHNAVFYLTALAAALTKLLSLYAEGGKRIRKACYWLLAGGICGFLFMTISRTGYLTAVILLFAAFVMQWFLLKEKHLLLRLLKSGLTFALAFVVMFPLVFGTVRYLPPVFHHPVWFAGEWNEWKVHSWDKWDSEKYINADQLFEAALGRIADILLRPLGDGGKAHAAAAVEPLNSSMQPPERPEGISDLQWSRYLDMLEKGYAIHLNDIDPNKEDTLLYRKHIYRYYLHYLNLMGYRATEQGFQLLPTYWIGHAHNIYLQCGLDFGIPVLLLFLALMIWTFCHLVKAFFLGDLNAGGYLLFFLIPCIFGLLEYCWGSGSLTITLLLISWRQLLCSPQATPKHP